MDLEKKIRAAEANGELLAEAASHLKAWLEAPFLPPWALSALEELAEQSAWEELNNRFYCNLAFGTGGMRGRTIGRQAASVECDASENPKHAAVGSACLNDFNIIRATLGLYRYCASYLGRESVPSLVIAHDVRFFSRHFCELTASTWTRLGGQAYIFAEPRSTPQLSYTLRKLGASAGVVITASHNPAHDNGYKVYFCDGGQMTPPHSEGIIDAVNRVDLSELKAFLDKDLSSIETLPESIDQAYEDALGKNLIHPEVFEETDLSTVFTPLHGVGAVIAPQVLKKMGVEVLTVEEQCRQDPRFPTVKVANPEYPEALDLGLKQAEKHQADLVLATDPDADRLGVAARNARGDLVQLTGNQVGAVLAEYRIRQLNDTGILPPEGSPRAALLKTFVTTPFLECIGQKHGVTVINTLTGFKWIGAKLQAYETLLKKAYRRKNGKDLNYTSLSADERRERLLSYSRYNILAVEESYGYLAEDSVRDKDAHAAALLTCELAAHLKAQGKTLHGFLDDLYGQYRAYFLESLSTLCFEGARGAMQIQSILRDYRHRPPRMLAGQRVVQCIDFGREGQVDADGQTIPQEDFYLIELQNACRYAIRASGTEPKLKCYFFVREPVPTPEALSVAKEKAAYALKDLVNAVETDAYARLG